MIGNNVYGGGNSPILIPYQDNCRHLYMSDKNSLGTNGWKDIIGSTDIITPTTINLDSSITVNSDYTIPFTDNFMTECFTLYIVCKRPESYTNTDWDGALNVVDVTAPAVDLTTYNLNWAIGGGAYGYDIFSTVNAKTYAVITIVFYFGSCCFYINNTNIGSDKGYHTLSFTRKLSNLLETKCIALYDDCHYSSQISTVYNYLNKKYLI